MVFDLLHAHEFEAYDWKMDGQAFIIPGQSSNAPLQEVVNQIAAQRNKGCVQHTELRHSLQSHRPGSPNGAPSQRAMMLLDGHVLHCRCCYAVQEPQEPLRMRMQEHCGSSCSPVCNGIQDCAGLGSAAATKLHDD